MQGKSQFYRCFAEYETAQVLVGVYFTFNEPDIYESALMGNVKVVFQKHLTPCLCLLRCHLLALCSLRLPCFSPPLLTFPTQEINPTVSHWRTYFSCRETAVQDR